MKPILIVDNEEKFCKVVKASLELEDLMADYVTSGEAAEKWLDNQDTDIIISDLRMEGMDGLELLKRIKSKSPSIDVIMMTAFASQKTAVEALKEGALDYLIKPFEMDELVLRVKRTLQQKKLKEENRQLRTQVQKPVYFDKIIGRSEAMKRIYQLIQKAAQSNTTVIILGESGTGKELVAETVHSSSERAEQPFVAINCAAVPENLLESELFGHEKGAFTGAFQKKIGKFEDAKNGTIFLDEIGDMSLAIQAKLLRVLQNKEIFRLGGNEKIKIFTRVIAATNRDLDSMVESKAFREDLFYRLNVFPIVLPPLRERKEDIPELVNHFIKSHDIVGIDREALKELMDHEWPGNIRELQNVLERASIMADSIINKQDLPILKGYKISETLEWDLPEEGFQLDEFEKFLIERALVKARGNKTRAAEILGITRRRLYSMMKSMGFSLLI
jgi:DNA-binding NtrC family response regulator